MLKIVWGTEEAPDYGKSALVIITALFFPPP